MTHPRKPDAFDDARRQFIAGTHPRCRQCLRLIDSMGRCGCPEESRRSGEFAGACFLGALIMAFALVAWGIAWAL